MSSTWAMMCVEKKTVLPRARRLSIISLMSRRPTGSSPDIGSSRMTGPGACRGGWGDAQALGHALRVAPSLDVPGGGELGQLEHRLDARRFLARWEADQTGAQPEDLPARQVVMEARVLGKVAEAPASLRPLGRGAEDLHRAVSRKDEAHDGLDRRGLARAVGAQKAE